MIYLRSNGASKESRARSSGKIKRSLKEKYQGIYCESASKAKRDHRSRARAQGCRARGSSLSEGRGLPRHGGSARKRPHSVCSLIFAFSPPPPPSPRDWNNLRALRWLRKQLSLFCGSVAVSYIHLHPPGTGSRSVGETPNVDNAISGLLTSGFADLGASSGGRVERSPVRLSSAVGQCEFVTAALAPRPRAAEVRGGGGRRKRSGSRFRSLLARVEAIPESGGRDKPRLRSYRVTLRQVWYMTMLLDHLQKSNIIIGM
ncbi:hypothetical protein H8958_017548 [Nasalis larvatus]